MQNLVKTSDNKVVKMINNTLKGYTMTTLISSQQKENLIQIGLWDSVLELYEHCLEDIQLYGYCANEEKFKRMVLDGEEILLTIKINEKNELVRVCLKFK